MFLNLHNFNLQNPVSITDFDNIAGFYLIGRLSLTAIYHDPLSVAGFIGDSAALDQP